MIVGIHDRDQENESGISFAMPSGADEEGEDEDESDIGVPCMGGGDQVSHMLSSDCVIISQITIQVRINYASCKRAD